MEPKKFSWILALYGVGLIGMIGWAENMTVLSPYFIVLTSAWMLFYSLKKWSWLVALGISLLGFLVEYYGVHHGVPFGFYEYGNGLGPLYHGVPYLIGLNWVVMSWMGWNFASFWFQIQSPLYRAMVSGLWMTSMDLLIEQVAPLLDYWLFTFNIIPWQNYLAWWWLGSAFSLFWNVTNQNTKWTPVFMGVVQLVFFLILVMVF